jgi:hypothetical protein
VNARTGVLAEDDRLADALLDVIDHPDRFDPRGFALETLGFPNAARGITKALQDLAHRTGRPWTRDIVAKRNAPNLRYVTLASTRPSTRLCLARRAPRGRALISAGPPRSRRAA